MRSVMKKSLVFAGACLVLAGGAVRADASDVVKAQVPFPFVVRGQTFPAGQYRFERSDTNPSILLIEGKRGTGAHMYVLTTGAAGYDPEGDKPALSFTRYENQYRLSNVWESATEGRTIEGKK